MITLGPVQGVFGVLSDAYVLLVPMVQVAVLRVSARKRLGLAGLFLTGLA